MHGFIDCIIWFIFNCLILFCINLFWCFSLVFSWVLLMDLVTWFWLFQLVLVILLFIVLILLAFCCFDIYRFNFVLTLGFGVFFCILLLFTILDIDFIEVTLLSVSLFFDNFKLSNSYLTLCILFWFVNFIYSLTSCFALQLLRIFRLFIVLLSRVWLFTF